MKKEGGIGGIARRSYSRLCSQDGAGSRTLGCYVGLPKRGDGLVFPVAPHFYWLA